MSFGKLFFRTIYSQPRSWILYLIRIMCNWIFNLKEKYWLHSCSIKNTRNMNHHLIVWCYSPKLLVRNVSDIWDREGRIRYYQFRKSHRLQFLPVFFCSFLLFSTFIYETYPPITPNKSDNNGSCHLSPYVLRLNLDFFTLTIKHP